jgi:quinol monooxygenase YgiN
MSDRVIYVDRFEINDGKSDDLRDYAEEIAAIAEEQAPGVLSFHYYVDGDGGRGTAVIIFADAPALDTYLEVASSHFQRGARLLRSTDVELLGQPSGDAAQVATAYGGRVMPQIVSFDR